MFGVPWLQDQLAHNQFFSGAAGLSIMGGVAYWFRSLPSRILDNIKWATTVTAYIHNNDPAYEHVVRWLSPRLKGWHVRNFHISSIRSNDRESFDEKITGLRLDTGYGDFFLWWKRRPMWVSREKESSPQSGRERRETLTIRMLGFNRKHLESFIDEAHQIIFNEETIGIYLWHNWWKPIDKRKPRPMSTVSLPDNMAEEMIADVEKFRAARDSYVKKGIPYRRGYMFAGPPGTGKTSAAFALSGHFLLPIYVMNLGSMDSDDDLFDAMTAVPANAVIVIEDIDAAQVTAVRKKKRRTGRAGPVAAAIANDTEDEDVPNGISLSALLNSIDGIVAKEGRILIMTTNHPEKIDPALLRAGRVDRRFDFTLATPKQAAEIYGKFFPEAESTVVLEKYRGNMSPADIQGICLQYAHSYIAALVKLTVGGKA